MKVCTGPCKKELSLDYFHKLGFDSKGEQRYRNDCKDCRNLKRRKTTKEIISYSRQKAVISIVNNVECKKCKTCNHWVPLSDFHKDGKYTDGTQRYLVHCKECRNRVVLKKKNINPVIFKDGICGRYCKSFCGLWKSEENFYKLPNGNLRSECIQCKREYSQKYIKKIRKEEPEKYQKLLKRKVEFRRNNLHAKLSGNLRRRLLKALKGNPKKDTTMNLVGCDIDFLWKHLESKFTKGMTRENYGEWHVDHVVPCAHFNLQREEEQRRCFHWRNLQPLWGHDNAEKSNKYTFNPTLEITLYFSALNTQ